MEEQIKSQIEKEISTNEVCLFMKGTPDAPQCGFSMAVSNMLKILEVNFKSVNVLENEQIRQGIKEFSEWPTIPQLYIKKEFVGGCDIVKEMYENGELKKILEKKKLILKNKLLLSRIIFDYKIWFHYNRIWNFFKLRSSNKFNFFIFFIYLQIFWCFSFLISKGDVNKS